MFTPINISLINHKNGEILQTIYFVGNIPKGVLHCLEKCEFIENSSLLKWQDESIITGYYGSKWKKLFLVNQLPSHRMTGKMQLQIFGGDEESEAFINFKELDMPNTAIPDIVPTHMPSNEVKRVKHTDRSRKSKPIFSSLYIEDQDTMAIIKQKIQTAASIPIFRQHLFYYINDEGPHVPYKLFCNDMPIPVNWKTINENIILAGAGIDNVLVENKNCMIEANDEFIPYKKFVYPSIFLIDFFNVVRPDGATATESIADILRDKLQTSILYYGLVIKYWPMLTIDGMVEALMKGTTTLIDNDTEKQLENASDLVALLQRPVRSETKIAVTKTTSIMYPGDLKMVINIRNIFDFIQTDESILAAYLRTDITVRKRNYKSFNSEVRSGIDKILESNIRKDTLLYIVRNSESDFVEMPFIIVKIQTNGQYQVSASWNEDDGMQFETIAPSMSSKIKKLIDNINKMGVASFPLSGKLETINSTAAVGLITGSAFWVVPLNNNMFKLLKAKMKKFENAGMITTYSMTHPNIFICNFSYNIIHYNNRLINYMYDRLGTDNLYLYMSDVDRNAKWRSVFAGRQIRIIHRATDIKIEISEANNIAEFNYIKNFFISFFEEYKNELLRVRDDDPTEKQLKKLQEQDPNLFDIKKYDKNADVYARFCQADRQPRIYLPGEKVDKNAIKYWNFTTNKPAFYSCESKQFPYLGFQSGNHPMGWCTPCCKKTKAAVNSKAYIMNEMCLSRKTVEDTSTDTKHVLAYGKPLFHYRIADCPKELDEGVFLNAIEHSDILKFKMIGVQQGSNAVENAGLMFCILFALSTEEDINGILHDIAKYVRTLKQSYISLGGGIGAVFDSCDELADCIITSFDNSASLTKFSVGGLAANWEHIITDIVYDLYDLSVVVFVQNLENITMTIKTVSSKIICVMKNVDTTYLIGAMKPSAYLKAPMEEKKYLCRKWFTNDSEVLDDVDLLDNGSDDIIKDNVHQIMTSFINTDEIADKFNIFSIHESNGSKYKIKHILLDTHNRCYGAVLHVPQSDRTVYCPLNYSTYPALDIKYDIRPEPSEKEDVDRLIKDFKLTIEHDIVTGNMHIGYIANGLYFFFRPCVAGAAGAANTTRSKHSFPYDTREIDQLIINTIRHIDSPEKLEVDYSYKAYMLFLTEFSNVLFNDKNQAIRKKLIECIQSIDPQNANSISDMRDNILKLGISIDDLTLIRDIIKQNYNKSVIISVISENRFNFDQQIITQLLKLQPSDQMRRIKELMEPLCTFTESHEPLTINNIYMSCKMTGSVAQTHCKNGKLSLHRKQFDTFCELLLADINNPSKRYILMSSAGVLDNMDFIKYPGEVLY